MPVKREPAETAADPAPETAPDSPEIPPVPTFTTSSPMLVDPAPIPAVPAISDPQAALWKTSPNEAYSRPIRVPDARIAAISGTINPAEWVAADTNIAVREEKIVLDFPEEAEDVSTVRSVSVTVYPGDVVIGERRVFHPVPTGTVDVSFQILAGPEEALEPALTALHHGQYGVGGRREITVRGESGFEPARIEAGFGEWVEERLTYDTRSGRGMYEIVREDGTENTVIVQTPAIEQGYKAAVECSRSPSPEAYSLSIEWLSLTIRRGDNAWELREEAEDREPVGETVATPPVDTPEPEGSVLFRPGSPGASPVVTLTNGMRLRYIPTLFPEGIQYWLTPVPDNSALMIASAEERSLFPTPIWVTFPDGQTVATVTTGLVQSEKTPPVSEVHIDPAALAVFPPYSEIADYVTGNGDPQDRFLIEEDLRSYIGDERSIVPPRSDSRVPDDRTILSALEHLLRTAEPGFELKSEYERWIDQHLYGMDTLDEARNLRQAILSRTLVVLDYVHENTLAMVDRYERALSVYLEEVRSHVIVIQTDGEALFYKNDIPRFRVTPPGTTITLETYLSYGAPRRVIFGETTPEETITPERVMSGIIRLQ